MNKKSETDQEQTRQRIAGAMHDAWAYWLRFLFRKAQHRPDGSVTIPAPLVQYFMKLSTSSYAELSTSEQLAKLAEADKILEVIND